jgi:hypothetical protein
VSKLLQLLLITALVYLVLGLLLHMVGIFDLENCWARKTCTA